MSAPRVRLGLKRRRGHIVSRLLIVRAKLGDAEAQVSVDADAGRSYPDLLDDMSAAVDRVMGQLVRLAAEQGVPQAGSRAAALRAMLAQDNGPGHSGG